METSEDVFSTPGAATVQGLEVRVSWAAVAELLSRVRSTHPLTRPRRSNRRRRRPSKFSPRVDRGRVYSGSEDESASPSPSAGVCVQSTSVAESE